MNKNKQKSVDQFYSFLRILNEFKKIQRLSLIEPRGRRESDAEHTWNLVMAVWLYSYLIDQKIDLLKSFKIALVHDLVEIYAGDIYDGATKKALLGKEKRERLAANKLFNQLPTKIAKEFHMLWNEFESKATLEARYVWSLDKLAPRFQHIITGSDAAEGMDTDYEKVAKQDREIGDFSPVFKYILKKIEKDTKLA